MTRMNIVSIQTENNNIDFFVQIFATTTKKTEKKKIHDDDDDDNVGRWK